MERPIVINLAHRKDRWEQAQNEFKKLDLIPYRIDAIRDEDGPRGCLASHILALQVAQAGPVWINEDDVEFVAPKAKIDELIEAFLQSDGEILCLVNRPKGIMEYNAVFDRAVDTDLATSYIVKPSFLPILLQLWQELYTSFKTNKRSLLEYFCKPEDNKTHLYTIDISWKILQPHHLFLIPKERVAIERSSYSDISHQIENRFTKQ
jgi:hypothetical protein